jgi:hypothetical protein
MLRDLATEHGKTLSAEVLVGERCVELLVVDISKVADVGTGGIGSYHGSSFGLTFLREVEELVVTHNNATALAKLIERCHPFRWSFAWEAQGINLLNSLSREVIRQTTRALNRPGDSLTTSRIRFSDQLHVESTKSRQANRARWMFPAEQDRELRTGH